MKNNKKKNQSDKIKLRTTISNGFIYRQKNLSYHTKCILSKIMTDMLCANEVPHFMYIEQNIFGIWPEEIVWDALQELADANIMYVYFDDEDEEKTPKSVYDETEDDEPEVEDGDIIFEPDFIEKVCPSFGHCPCCNPAPVNFNVNYN